MTKKFQGIKNNIKKKSPFTLLTVHVGEGADRGECVETDLVKDHVEPNRNESNVRSRTRLFDRLNPGLYYLSRKY